MRMLVYVAALSFCYGGTLYLSYKYGETGVQCKAPVKVRSLMVWL